VQRVDVGPDGLAGTGDDRTITLFDQDRATLGQNRTLITNNKLYNQRHRSVEVTATKRFSRRWQMLAGYTWARTTQDLDTNSNARNPNSLINGAGPVFFDRTHTLKATGSYLLPWDVSLSGNFRYQTGAPFTRTLRQTLTQGTVTVNADPRGSSRLDALTTVDARVSKIFKLNGRELEAMVDGYNLTNAVTAYDIRTLTGRITFREGGLPTGALVEQQQFFSPISILPPRIFRLGLSYRF
jgi:hypothetical protein